MADTSFISATGKKVSKTIKPFSEKSVYKISTAKMLLSSPHRKNIISSIKNTVNAPEEYYYILYEKLIHNFVEFVQILPVNNEARLASLMDEGLLRSLYALEDYKQDNTEDFDPLIAYLLFSSALLFDVGCVAENRTVIICNKKGEFQRKWNPHDGPMRVEDGYYRIRRGGGATAWSSRRLNVLFASQLMTREGFGWLYDNIQIYNMWISLLNYDREGAGRFSMYLDRSLDKLERVKLTSEFALPLDVELIKDSEGLSEAEDFIEWLTQGLKDGKITVNSSNSRAFLVEEGLLLTSDLFKQYNDAIERDIKMSTMLEQLEKLGYTDGKMQVYSQSPVKVSSIRSGIASLFHDTHSAVESSKMIGDIAKATQESKVGFVGTGAALEGPVLHTLLETFIFPTSALSTAVRMGQIKTAAESATKNYPIIENIVTPDIEPTVKTTMH